MVANHSIAIDLLFHLMVFTLDSSAIAFDYRNPRYTEGSRLPEAEFLWQISREFRYRLNPSQDFSFFFGFI
ncbi:hypothetical protein [Microcoleus vaginatus]|uniref:hypothetical protein n=1 Tax=Microcoleus vaginatus TaxID=119532 RepID=UPI00403F3F87